MDVTTVSAEVVCSSDEECPDKKKLLYLPCAPEVEENSDDEYPECSWRKHIPERRSAEVKIKSPSSKKIKLTK